MSNLSNWILDLIKVVLYFTEIVLESKKGKQISRVEQTDQTTIHLEKIQTLNTKIESLEHSSRKDPNFYTKIGSLGQN